MKAPGHKFLVNVAKVAAVGVLIVVALRFYAVRQCDAFINEEVAPPPYFSTQFVLHPHRHMEGIASGIRPGWVVSYVPPTKGYGTAFFVSLWGKVEARGTPELVQAHLGQQKQDGHKIVAKFRKAFSRIDAAAEVGHSYSKALPELGTPLSVVTNSDGLIEADFVYMPDTPPGFKVDWLTNGLSVRVRNDIIVSKSYSYTSSP